MRKLIQGMMQFRRERRDGLKETFERLALGQAPDALFIACSDSRVAANVFASTDPGDLFVLRNVGNLVPSWSDPGAEQAAAAVDFAVEQLSVRNIIVCGHSDCGAMHALCEGREALSSPALRRWLSHGEEALKPLQGGPLAKDANALSKQNVLLQLRHLRGYPSVAAAQKSRGLGLHGIWFDLHNLDVYYYEEAAGAYVLLDDDEGGRILSTLKDTP
jgi:carbonic anhydrase